MKYAIILGSVLLAVVLAQWFTPYDDTDKGREIRSGFELLTDYGTGCQWLSYGLLRPIVPRVDATGKQVCRP